MTSLPRRSSLGYLINHLGRLLGNGPRVDIAGTGVTPGQSAQLLALYERDGLLVRGIGEAELEAFTRTLRRMIDNLETAD
ncbi:hypothetical protein [Nonomuraea sp. NPDC050643]|uniref:hypothetical protein n=1 Tax=Nonomuraea sp. NPDC050643 TaxID=3155660 RepID=UPI0033E411EA